jgi:hypothetical protein
MLEEEELKDAALCIFANKQDLPGALTAPQVAFREIDFCNCSASYLGWSAESCDALHRLDIPESRNPKPKTPLPAVASWTPENLIRKELLGIKLPFAI